MKKWQRMCGAVCVLASLLAMAPATARADGAEILNAVPQNAWATLIVRNLGEFDQKLQGVAQQLNVPPMSLLMMAKMSTGLASGINDNGSAALVFMPSPNVMADPTSSLAIVIPAQDYAVATAAMSPEDMGDGVSKAMFVGQESYIGKYGNYVVAAQTPETIKSVLAAQDGAGIGSEWSSYLRERFSDDDITLFINTKEVLNDPMIGQMLQMVSAMSGGQMNIEEIKENEAMAVGLRIGKDGLRLGFHAKTRPGSNSAKLIASSKPTTDSLLMGLPNDNYFIAAGVNGSEAIWQKYGDTISGILANPMNAAQSGIPQEKLTALGEKIKSLVGSVRDVSFSAVSLPEGDGGLFGLTKVLTVSGGADAKCKEIGELINSIIALAPEEEAKQAMELIKFQPDAETLAGVKVTQIKIHADQAPGVSEEDYREMQKVFGKDAIVIRLAAVDDKHIVSALGGGPERFEKLIALAKSGGTPLGENAGIKKAAALLDSSRTVEAYLAVDTLLQTIKNINAATGNPDEIPFEIPKVDMPIGMVMHPAGDSGFQIDVAIPMALISATKDVVASSQGGGPNSGSAHEPADATQPQ